MELETVLREPRVTPGRGTREGRRRYGTPVRMALAQAAVLTALINVLSLAGSCYVLAIYDVVMPAKSGWALAGLTLAMAGLSAICCLLEVCRGRVLSRGGAALERSLRSRVLQAVKLLPLRLRGVCSPAQPVRDLEQVRACLTGAGGSALLDLPAVPIFLAVIYLQHATLGHFATGGVLLAISIAFGAQALAVRPHSAAAGAWVRLLRLCEALGSRDEMPANLEKRWCDLAEARTRWQQRAAVRSATGAAAIKASRASLQTGIVGVGAWLVMHDEISPGAMVVASILAARALTPVEAAAAQWRSVTFAYASWRRLEAAFDALAEGDAVPRSLPTRCYKLAVDRLAIPSAWMGPLPSVRLRSEAVSVYARPTLE